ncbi:MAG TPA: hypothetical protein DCF84_03040 [Bacteroidetes bacterium]|nr:hypothetical protein [Bacteroidota bacterium]
MAEFYLIVSILSSVAIMLVFGMFDRFKVDTFQAVVVNYLTCIGCGVVLNGGMPQYSMDSTTWLPYALCLGVLFIGLFVLIGITAQRQGAAIASVSMKLGLIFPILLAYFLYNEDFTIQKWIGIVLCLAAIIFVSIPSKDSEAEGNSFAWNWSMLFPLIIFLGSGICDSTVQFVEQRFFAEGDLEPLTIALFGTAYVVGASVLLLQVMLGKRSFDSKSLLAGVVLGLPNYASIYFFLMALSHDKFENASSFVFVINNIGIVVMTTLMGILILKQKPNQYGWIGLSLAVGAVLLLSL